MFKQIIFVLFFSTQTHTPTLESYAPFMRWYLKQNHRYKQPPERGLKLCNLPVRSIYLVQTSNSRNTHWLNKHYFVQLKTTLVRIDRIASAKVRIIIRPKRALRF